MILQHLVDKLRGLFRKTHLAREAEATAARLEEKVLALVDNMPTLPDTATRALELAKDPESKFADFARLIEADAAIATGILRVANSALYAGGLPAVKLQQAVVRLGMRQCQNVIVAIGMRSLFQRVADNTRRQCVVLWDHAYVVASLCRQINRAFRLGFDGEEFSAGLLHDLGRILLVLADVESFAQADGLDFREEAGFLKRERSLLGTDHCELGGWFGEHSKLPPALIEVMHCHHDPSQAAKAKGLTTLVATADHMANHLQRGEDLADYDPSDNLGLCCLWERWPEERRRRLLDQLPGVMEEAVRAAAEEQGGS